MFCCESVDLVFSCGGGELTSCVVAFIYSVGEFIAQPCDFVVRGIAVIAGVIGHGLKFGALFGGKRFPGRLGDDFMNFQHIVILFLKLWFTWI